MKYILGFIGALITLIGCFHVYLNAVYPEEYSFEEAIKILVRSFKENPKSTFLYSLSIILFSSFIGWVITKLINRRKNREKQTQSNIEKQKRINELKTEFFAKVNEYDTQMSQPLRNPMLTIAGDYYEMNVKDINDDSYPESTHWWKLQTFNITDEGIEFLGSENISGYDIYIDSNNKWDSVSRSEKINPKLSLRKITAKTYAIQFLPYENIAVTDWSKDPREGNITLHCHYTFKNPINGVRHPFQAFRYYYETEFGCLPFEERSRRNFKKSEFKLRKIILMRYRTWNFYRKLKKRSN